MESKPISDYIWFGTALRFLQDAQPGFSVHEVGYVLHNIDEFFGYVSRLNLVVTDRAADDLAAFRAKLADTGPDHKLTAAEASELSRITSDLRKTLFAEASGHEAFIVTDKRIQVDKLLGQVPNLMAPGVFDSLPDIAQYDFEEAGKCIAFERPTAAAFHLLRATESMLRNFYCFLVRRGRTELLWGPMVTSLREHRAKPPAELLDNLDNIRRSFRNPTQHPEKIYDIEEVQDLFALCVDVVNRMVRLMSVSTKVARKTPQTS